MLAASAWGEDGQGARVHEEVGRLLVSGANGNLGRRLIERVLREGRISAVEAVVRSSRAAGTLDELRELGPLRVHVVDPLDPDAWAGVSQGCTHAVHLVGILKEGAGTRYADAHEGTTTALARAAAKNGLRRIVYLSILGAELDSGNACLASKARAERILWETPVSSVVLQVPMVLGPGEPGARALRGQIRARRVALVGGGRSLEQPIDAEDVTEAILRSLVLDVADHERIELGGPESLPRRELLARAARAVGRASPGVIPVPRAAAGLLAWLCELTLANGPITRAMLGVLEHDDAVDPGPACTRLGMELTPLDETLRRYLAGDDPR